jgi:hypothetical protein
MARVPPDEELKRRLIPPDRRVFLSYARLDDEVPALDPEAKGWVRYLYDQLRLALRHRLGGEFEFWRDRRDINENELFEDLIEEGLKGSAHLLAVVSPGYLKSAWCQREWRRFVEMHGGETRQTIERIVKVLKHCVDEASLPPVFQKREGYRFFALDPDHPMREVPFFLNGKMRREAEYLDVVERLVQYLVECLGGVPKLECSEAAPKLVAVPTAGQERTVFLAMPQGTDASEPALRVRLELQAAELAVSAPPASPTTEAEARTALRQVLGQADAAVHIVGRSAGALLRDGQVPAVHLQLEESARRADEPPSFRRYILLLASTEEGNEFHKTFVGRLQQDLSEGGFLRPNDHLIIEQPGGMTVQDFIQVLRMGLKPFREEPKPFREDPKPFRERLKPFRDESKPFREEPKPFREEPKPFRGELNP